MKNLIIALISVISLMSCTSGGSDHTVKVPVPERPELNDPTSLITAGTTDTVESFDYTGNNVQVMALNGRVAFVENALDIDLKKGDRIIVVEAISDNKVESWIWGYFKGQVPESSSSASTTFVYYIVDVLKV